MRHWNLSVVVCVGVLALTLSLASSAIALGLRSIEVNGGFVSIEDDIGSTFTVGAIANLGYLMPNLSLETGVDFWTKSYDIGFLGENAEWTYTNIGILGGVRYDFPVSSPILPFAFGGLGLHVARVSGETSFHIGGVDYSEDASDNSMEFGARFGGGIEYGLSEKMDFIARAGYDINGGANYFFVTGGVQFGVGK
jgi:hypothetical protein